MASVHLHLSTCPLAYLPTRPSFPACTFAFRHAAGDSGFGPKCLSMTIGSVALGLVIRTPAWAAAQETKYSSLRQLAEANQRRGLDGPDAQRAVALQHDQAVRPRVTDGDRAARQHGQLFRGKVRVAVGDPVLDVTFALHLRQRFHRPRRAEVIALEVGVDVDIPIQHRDDVVQVVLELRRHVLHQQLPPDRHFVHQRLEHGEDVAGPLRLIGAQAAGRVQGAGRHIPARAQLQPIGLRQVGDVVVALVPDLQAMAHLVLGRPRLQAEVGVGGVGAVVVQLAGKVVGFGLRFHADAAGVLLHLVEVVGQRRLVVEELANTSARRGAHST